MVAVELIKLITVSVILQQCYAQVYYQPEQIHLAYGDNPTQMTITWVTPNEVNESLCAYGYSNVQMLERGRPSVFVDGGSQKRNIFIHRITLNLLMPGKKYWYRVGSWLGWSDKLSFTAMPAGTDWSPTFAVYGDMGNVNGRAMARLQQEAQDGYFDAVLHVGDMAYNMDTDNARVGDAFMNQIQQIAAYVPYMTAVGNHEQEYNFSNYKNRFTMPGEKTQGMFYSIDIGPVHFVMFSSEFYYFVQYGWTQIVEQYRWLEKDLAKANEPENRQKRPWIITMCHRPLYCSNSNDPEHCPNVENIIRIGLPILKAYSIEDLLYKYGVDVHFQAHEHSYERMWPVYNLTVCNSSTSNPYLNPRAPIHIVTGSAGCQELVDPFEPIPHPWSAYHSMDYGFTRMKVYNSTHLYMEQTSDDQMGKVIDSMMIIKQKHGMGLYDCHLDNQKNGPMMEGFNYAKEQERKAKLFGKPKAAKHQHL